jgi:hypothetical protein
VLGSWSGSEEQAFLAMVNPFERDSGITVDYEGTRDLNGLLWESVAKGTPPDVAGLPGPGQMAEFARHGSLKDLGATIVAVEPWLGDQDLDRSVGHDAIVGGACPRKRPARRAGRLDAWARCAGPFRRSPD